MVETIVALSQGNARIMAEAVELMQNDARPRIILDPNPNLLAACDEAIRLTTDHLADDDAPRGLDAATARNLRHICRAAIAKAGRA